MKRINLVLASLCLTLASAIAQAADAYPAKSVRLVVPYAPGGFSEGVARLLTEKLKDNMGQVFIVESRPGGNSIIGSDIVAKAAPDGYTLLLAFGSHPINPYLFPNMPFDPIKDFSGVSILGWSQTVLVVSAALPINTFRDFVQYAKANPGKLTYAASGAISHLNHQEFARAAGIELTHVPYKGISPSLPDMFAGRISGTIETFLTLGPHIKSGKLRALAVATPTRWVGAPEIPTMTESGVKYVNESWMGVVAPAKTPADILKKLAGAMAQVQILPDVKAKYVEWGILAETSSPEQFDALIRRDYVEKGKLIKELGLKFE